MNKNLFKFGGFLAVFFITLVLIVPPKANAQVYQYDDNCDITSQNGEVGVADGAVDEFDLLEIKELTSSTSPELRFCDTDGNGVCNVKDFNFCRKSLGSMSTTSPVGISNYNDEIAVGTTYSKDYIKARIVAGNYSMNDQPRVNVADSSWFEDFYDDFKYIYTKRRYMASTSWADLDDNDVIDKNDKKMILQYRKAFKKAYGTKIISDSDVSARIMNNEMDLNEDGAVNILDKKVAYNLYKKLKLHLRGKVILENTSIYNFDNTNQVIDNNDRLVLRKYINSMSKYRHLFNFNAADVKAKILEDDFDMNNDDLVNLTDYHVVRRYYKDLIKVKKSSQFNGDYNLNGDSNVDSDDAFKFKRFYIIMKQHKKSGKITNEVPDDIAPYIRLKKDPEITLNVGQTYRDPGFTVWDNRARGLSRKVEIDNGGLDVNVPGTYTITYAVSDGVSTTTMNRVVNIVGSTQDTTPGTDPTLSTQATRGQMCDSATSCSTDLECKSAGSYGGQENYCCGVNECVSVSPNDDPAINCIEGGGEDTIVTDNGESRVTCDNGVWYPVNP